jgi:peptidoglycan/LPS O-acetylase OafA/YrhL
VSRSRRRKRATAGARSRWRYVPELDGLRALAVVSVVGYSYDPKSVPGGYLGATVFFVLSGYLITGALAAEHRRNRRVDLKAFYIRRLLRIYPALIAVVLLALIGAAAAGHRGVTTQHIYEAAGAALGSLNGLLLANGHSTGWLDPTWSICVELQFYLVWPLLLVKALRTQPRESIGLWCYVAAVVFAYLQYKIWSNYGFERTYFTPIGSLLPLAAGCAVALTRGRPAGRAMREATWVASASAAVLVGLVIAGPGREALSSWREAQPGATIAAGAVIFYLVEGPGVKLLRVRPLVWLGHRSYAVYLVHAVVLFTLLNASPGLSRLAATCVGVPVTIALAELSYRYLEGPFLRRKRHFARLTPTATTPEPTTP